MIYIVAQGIGFVALFFAVMAFQSNKREKLLFFQLLSATFYLLNLFLLGAYTGAVVMAFGVIRNCIFIQKGKKKWASSPVWVFIFIGIFTISGLLTYENIFSILPIIGMSLGTISFWMTKPSHIRKIAPTMPIIWIVYDYVSGSISGIIIELFYLTSVIVGIIRFDLLKQSEEKTES